MRGVKGRHPSVGIFLTGKQDVELILPGLLISSKQSLMFVKDLSITLIDAQHLENWSLEVTQKSRLLHQRLLSLHHQQIQLT